ncbi:hypothetical protein E3N88_10496 [Mikania micrantha]|uniref:Uncharacterized protein n=1 Tax=Mikania micrantha TaxID=192012 RepID=A0A5N6PAU5_9ASTR|nr:hypothetical protein E3N88_10496 [Mikania micrantha]
MCLTLGMLSLFYSDQHVCCQHLLYHKANQLQSLSENYSRKPLSLENAEEILWNSLSLENAEEILRKPLIFGSFIVFGSIIVFGSSEALDLLSFGLPKWFVLYSLQ